MTGAGLPIIRRVQLAMVLTWICVDVGADDFLEPQHDFEEAFEEMINAPLAGPEGAALRLRCLTQIGDYFEGCTSTDAQIYYALRGIADGLAGEQGRIAADAGEQASNSRRSC